MVPSVKELITMARLRPLPISRTEIARRTKLSLAHISKIFTTNAGARRNPSAQAAQKIAASMGWTTDQLLDYLRQVHKQKHAA